MIDDGEVARRLVLAMDALTLIDGGEVEEHAIRARYSFAQIIRTLCAIALATQNVGIPSCVDCDTNVFAPKCSVELPDHGQ